MLILLLALLRKMWGVLTRVGGAEQEAAVPKTIQLNDGEVFFGRFAAPAPNHTHFTHKTQTLLDCPYVSSTHFSIKVVKGENGSRSYVLTDHSRNGTYLNASLVGPNKETPLPDNGEIGLMYKNKMRVVYRFTAVDDNLVPVKEDDHNGAEDSSRLASAKSQAESVAETLAKQVAVLQEESKNLEQRIQQQAARIETGAQDLDRANAKVGVLEKSTAVLQEEKADLTERLATAESHAAAIEARSVKLQEQLEESRAELKELKVKAALMQEELQSKTAQLETRNTLMVDSNKTMAHEQKQWKRLEARYERATADLETARDQNTRFTAVNQALQAVVSDQESALTALRRQNEQLLEIVAAGRAAVTTREAAFAEVHRVFGQAAALLATAERQSAELAQRSDYFDTIAAGASELKWVGSQLNENNDTYVEAYPPSGRFTPGEVGARAGDDDHHGARRSSGSVTSDSDTDSESGLQRGRTAETEEQNGGNGKRKRVQEDADGDGAVMPWTPSSVAPRTAGTDATADSHGNNGNGVKRSRVGALEPVAEGDGAECDDDLHRTQAQANFAHLFEDISQPSQSDAEADEAGAPEETKTGGRVQHGDSSTYDQVHDPPAGKSLMQQDSHSGAESADSVDHSQPVAVKTVSPGGNALVQQKIEAVRARTGEAAQKSGDQHADNGGDGVTEAQVAEQSASMEVGDVDEAKGAEKDSTDAPQDTSMEVAEDGQATSPVPVLGEKQSQPLEVE